MRQRSRRGFNLVELLIVVGIVAVLLALLIPAVLKVRAEAARMTCTNNLKQIGIALVNYHSANDHFPPGYESGLDDGKETGPGWGWAMQAIPYIECGDLYHKIDKTAIDVPANAPHRTLAYKPYRCPADSAPDTFTVTRRDPVSGTVLASFCDVAAANYAGVFGTDEPDGEGDGILFRNSKVSLKDVTDGGSNTLLVGERAFLHGETTWVRAVPGATMSAPPGSPLPARVLGSSGHVLGHTRGAWNGPALPHRVGHFSSRHPGGTQFVFADGHVSLLGASVDYEVYKALSTRAGGETITGGF